MSNLNYKLVECTVTIQLGLYPRHLKYTAIYLITLMRSILTLNQKFQSAVRYMIIPSSKSLMIILNLNTLVSTVFQQHEIICIQMG